MMGMFLAALDQTIVATAIRIIADDLNDLAGQAWVDDGIPHHVHHRDAALRQARRHLRSQEALPHRHHDLHIGSMLCALASSIPPLAVFRAVQGLGAGGLFSLALAIIGDIVPPRERAKYQGYFLAVFGTATRARPGHRRVLRRSGDDPRRHRLALGLPRQRADRRRRTRRRHPHAPPQPHPPRPPHRLARRPSLSVALVPLLIVAEQGREWGWDSATGRSPATRSACSASSRSSSASGAMGRRRSSRCASSEQHGRRRPRSPRSSSASAMFGGLAALPLYLQIVKGATPTQAGLQLLPMTLGIMVGSIISGQIISRTGRYRKFPIIGLRAARRSRSTASTSSVRTPRCGRR